MLERVIPLSPAVSELEASVLILVVLERVIPGLGKEYKNNHYCLNPCCVGKGDSSQSARKYGRI